MDLLTSQERLRFSAIAIAAMATVLAGCGSVPLTADNAPSAQPPATAARVAVPVLPPAGSGRGGYYQDDGPGDAPPENLLTIPDAVPRIEPIGKRGNRRYVVFGKAYIPIIDERPYKERGRGSWYGKKFHGQKTSSGEIYDMYKMTAAHPTLPLPSYVRVTNVENGRKVVVRVNDRGPFLAGRIIDLSYTAALKLGYLEKGSALLEVERLLPDEIRRMNETSPTPPITASGDSDVESAGVTEITEVAEVTAAAAPVRTALLDAPVVQAEPAASQPQVAAAAPDMAPAGVYLQLGAFGQAANAQAVRNRYAQQSGVMLPPIQVVEQGALYRVLTGPFASRAEAEAAAQQLQRNDAFTPMIVQR